MTESMTADFNENANNDLKSYITGGNNDILFNVPGESIHINKPARQNNAERKT